MMIKISMMAMLHKRGGLTGRAQWVGFFNIRQVRVSIEKKSVAGRFRSGRSVEIFDRIFPGTLFTCCQNLSGVLVI